MHVTHTQRVTKRVQQHEARLVLKLVRVQVLKHLEVRVRHKIARAREIEYM